jgi:hypothetical protein
MKLAHPDSSVNHLRRQIESRWPETGYSDRTFDSRVFTTGLKIFDSLFPMGGIPYGQLIEITGKSGGGKTSVLFRLLAGMLREKSGAGMNIGYVDFSNSFFPTAAEYGGIDPSRLFIVKPDTTLSGLRAAELLLRHNQARIIVCDLVGIKTTLPMGIMHRLRRKTARAKGLVIFLTENNPDIVPASMTSLRLNITRIKTNRIRMDILKSRLSSPGKTMEVDLDKA